jgi:hypothetical protein
LSYSGYFKACSGALQRLSKLHKQVVAVGHTHVCQCRAKIGNLLTASAN